MKGIFISIFILLVVFTSVNAEVKMDSVSVSASSIHRNIIYTDAQFWLLGGSVDLNYERIIHSGMKGCFSLRGAVGQWAMLYDTGDMVRLSGGYIRGHGSHHFEADLGALLLVHYDQYYADQKKFDHLNILPDLFLGYRYQKPGGYLMFKAGTGFPGLLSAGIGVAF